MSRSTDTKDESASKPSDDEIYNIAEAVQSFIRSMEAIETIVPLLMIFLAESKKHWRKKFEKLRDDFGTVISEQDGKQEIRFDVSHAGDAQEKISIIENLNHATDVTPKSFIITIVSQYDSFLASLLKSIFLAKPEIINSSERPLLFSELVKFEDIDDARDFIIEKEIETILRLNHAKQFEKLEKLFSINLRKDLSVWPKFIEVTERRNLFTHADGVVSNQYLRMCQEHGFDVSSDTTVGSRLAVDGEYFIQAHDVIFEIGIKLGHVLWRKIVSDEILLADESLNGVSYTLLKNKKYNLAIAILEFATNAYKKFGSEEIRRYMILNKANAYKLAGNNETCKKIIDSEDWETLENKYKIAIAALNDDFGEAARIMKIIGKDGEVAEMAYHEWPIFNGFRNSKEFLDTYQEVFEQPFSIVTKTNEK